MLYGAQCCAAFKPAFGLSFRPRFLILAHCALYLYCASIKGKGNRKEPQKRVQSLKISPVLSALLKLDRSPQNPLKSTKNPVKTAPKTPKYWGKIPSKIRCQNPSKIGYLSGCSVVTSTTHCKYSAYAKSRNRGSRE